MWRSTAWRPLGRSLPLAAAVALSLSLLWPAASRAEAVPGELIVRFEADSTGSDRAAARRAAGVTIERALPFGETQLVSLQPGTTTAQALAGLERNPDVLYAERNVIRRALATPDDHWFPYLWGLQNAGQTVRGVPGAVDADVDATEAYDLALGAGAVVAVVDTGLATDHPDLEGAAWTNPGEAGELAANGIDDDANGYVDDVHGWDWVDDDNSPQDDHGHGTHVAGTVAARADNALGVAGVAPQARLVGLRVLDASGSGSVSDLIAAYRYAARTPVRVVNLSLGGASPSQAERDALAAARDVLFVVAAGNGGGDGVGDDNDSAPEYPCAYDLQNVVCVAATDQQDRLAGFSNFGATSVDLAAPGVNILSTLPKVGAEYTESDYGFTSGTSMATPHVSGVAALLLGRTPDLSIADLRQALLTSVDPLPALAGRTATGGRLNAQRALDRRAPASAPLPPASAPAATPVTAPLAAPVPPPVTTPSRDRTSPTVSVAVASSGSFATVRRRGLRARIRCSEPCGTQVELTVGPALARRLGLSSGRRGAVLGRTMRTVRGSAAVTVRIGSVAWRRLSRQRTSVPVTLLVRARDAAGNERAVRRLVVLRR